MTLTEIITQRRNVKEFKADPVDFEQIKAMLQTATMAPNHKMTEPWEILVIGEETRQKLNHKPNFGNAPLVLAFLSLRGQNAIEREENLMTSSCFVQNFLLLAHEQGIATRWASLGMQPANREIMGVSEDYDVIGVFGTGYPVEWPEAKTRTPIEEKIRFSS